MILALGLAWGVLAVVPLRRMGRRVTTSVRARDLKPRIRTRRRSRKRLVAPNAVRVVALVFSAPARARRRRRAEEAFAREVAVAVDLIGVAVAAGCTPYLAIDMAARWAPANAGRELDRVVRDCNTGVAFDAALRAAGVRAPGVRPLSDALRTSASLGSPVLPVLARLAAELRADLRRRAEARARTVPVRLCFPLVGCVLPAFALLTVVPVVFAGLHG